MDLNTFFKQKEKCLIDFHINVQVIEQDDFVYGTV